MSELTYNEYWEEVRDTAYTIVEECMGETDNNRDDAEELINDSRLHETVDGHQWIIYYSYNLDVIKHSDNEDYYADNFGGESLEHSLKEGGIDTLHCHIAFWAFYADIQDYLETAFEEYEESIAA